ncbi:hypothetical protein [Neomesorhizobium albiziae]|uniref:hypothetical protein n=1 Tax=Neomesorhizobium albiziae TaxID=335020 RepID=UPI00165FADB2|nr:hypothetical protein [Mesorhizobium albiziae]GLS32466.1 hypothetical protein GCM10007937_41760 [Mesorhizobium albiziae]
MSPAAAIIEQAHGHSGTKHATEAAYRRRKALKKARLIFADWTSCASKIVPLPASEAA